MKRLIFGLGMATAALLGSPAAMADDTMDVVHCYIVFTRMAGSGVPEMQSSGTIGTFYWLGRLDALPANDKLADIIADEMATMTAAQLAAEATRCGGYMVERGKQITEMEKAIAARVQEIQTRQNSR